MAPSRNVKAYELEFQLLTQALESQGKGIEVEVPEGVKLTTFRHRLNSARVADRKRSLEMYAEGDPQRGRSLFDTLVIRIDTARGVIVIERPRVDGFKVKEV